MGYSNDVSNVPRLALGDQKDLLLYAMKIVPGDYKDFLNDYYEKQHGEKYKSKNKYRSRNQHKKRNGRKSRKKKNLKMENFMT